MRFDWYQASVMNVDQDSLLGHLSANFDLASVRPSPPKNGYLRGAEVHRGDRVLAKVWWGGNPGVHVVGTGEDAPLVAKALASGRERLGWQFYPTRIDSCLDIIEKDAFDLYSSSARVFAVSRRLSIEMQGDWERGKSRTIYLGSRQSQFQLVIYEKGQQLGVIPGQDWMLDWTRIEGRLFPKQSQRSMVANFSPQDIFSGVPWVSDLIHSWGFELSSEPRLSSLWRPADDDRARAAMLRQYGRCLSKWIADVGQSQFGSVVVAKLAEGEESAKRCTSAGASSFVSVGPSLVPHV